MAIVIVLEFDATRIGPPFRTSNGYVRAAVICPIAEREAVEMAIADQVLSALAVLMASSTRPIK